MDTSYQNVIKSIPIFTKKKVNNCCACLLFVVFLFVEFSTAHPILTKHKFYENYSKAKQVEELTWHFSTLESESVERQNNKNQLIYFVLFVFVCCSCCTNKIESVFLFSIRLIVASVMVFAVLTILLLLHLFWYFDAYKCKKYFCIYIFARIIVDTRRNELSHPIFQ